jgi:hypothetical protein
VDASPHAVAIERLLAYAIGIIPTGMLPAAREAVAGLRPDSPLTGAGPTTSRPVPTADPHVRADRPLCQTSVRHEAEVNLCSE